MQQYPQSRSTGRYLRGPHHQDPIMPGIPGEETAPDIDGEVVRSDAQHARDRTEKARAELASFRDLLRRTAQPGAAVDFESQRRTYEPRPYGGTGSVAGAGSDAGSNGMRATADAPQWEDFAPPEPPTPTGSGADGADDSPGRRLLNPGFQRELAEAKLRHQRALREWRERQAQQAQQGGAPGDFEQDRIAHDRAEQARARAVREYNASLDECRRAYQDAEPAAVESLLERALAAAENATPDLSAPCRVDFRPLTRTAVLELELPSPDIMPSVAGYRLGPEGSGLEPIPHPDSERTTHYLQLVARLALRALHAVAAADSEGVLAGALLNASVCDSGSASGSCLLTVDADRDDLARAWLLPVGAEATAPDQEDSLAVLQSLPCTVSPDPYAPVAVRPYGRAGAAVPAPGDLSPGEFARLVRELLTRMGLDDWTTRLRGRDGLVAIADGAADSLLPGRWVVWAVRRPEAVDVEAVRTLAEAVAEEEAEGGLWLTTARFTPEAVEAAAAEGNLLLLDSDRLRVLLRTHLDGELAGG